MTPSGREGTVEAREGSKSEELKEQVKVLQQQLGEAKKSKEVLLEAVVGVVEGRQVEVEDREVEGVVRRLRGLLDVGAREAREGGSMKTAGMSG